MKPEKARVEVSVPAEDMDDALQKIRALKLIGGEEVGMEERPEWDESRWIVPGYLEDVTVVRIH